MEWLLGNIVDAATILFGQQSYQQQSFGVHAHADVCGGFKGRSDNDTHRHFVRLLCVRSLHVYCVLRTWQFAAGLWQRWLFCFCRIASSALHAPCDYSMTSKPLQLALLFIVPNRTFWSYSDSRHLVLCPSVSKKYQVNKFHEVIVNHFPIFISLF